MFQNVYKGKKVLVTGHTGFKGSWLSLWLLNLGAKVIGLSKSVPTRPAHYSALNLKEHITSYDEDIINFDGFKKIINQEKPDFVFHLAAEAIVKNCLDSPLEAFKTNTLGTIHLLEALRTTPSVSVAVFITSDKCYENVEWHYGYREIDHLGGKDPYSASKACAEHAISAYFRSYFSQLSTKIASTRAGNVIGGGDWADYRIVPDCMRSWSNNEVVNIRNPLATRPWQLVLEPLSGYLSLGSSLYQSPKKINGESFNFGPGAEVTQTVEELVKAFKTYWDGKLNISRPEKESMEAGLLKLSIDKAQSLLNWYPTLNFEETVEFTINWYKNYYQEEKTTFDYSLNQIKKYMNLAKERKRAWMN